MKIAFFFLQHLENKEYMKKFKNIYLLNVSKYTNLINVSNRYL